MMKIPQHRNFLTRRLKSDIKVQEFLGMSGRLGAIELLRIFSLEHQLMFSLAKHINKDKHIDLPLRKWLWLV